MDKDLIFLIYKGLSGLEEETLYFKINNSLPFTPGEIVNGYSTIPICALPGSLVMITHSNSKNYSFAGLRVKTFAQTVLTSCL